MRGATHLKDRDLEPAVIQTSDDYTYSYRYRLWVSIVEDMSSLGMGYRAYHNHILRSLNSWRRTGTVFLSSSGEPLNFDALASDDLWGFLGKESHNPKGPARKISPAKLAVLDVFIKAKYPTIQPVLERQSGVVALSAAMKNFFVFPGVDEFKGEALNWYNESISGVYFPELDFSLSTLLEDKRRERLMGRALTAYIINSRSDFELCVVHRVEVPLSARYINLLHEERQKTNDLMRIIERHAPKQTFIYSGVAYSSSLNKGFMSDRAICLMRDRTTYEPYVSNLRFIRDGSSTRSDYLKSKAYGACEGLSSSTSPSYKRLAKRESFEVAKEKLCISEDFVDLMFEFSNKLGMEI